MNELRQELMQLLSGTESSRPATLRRSLREDFLYATDLPQATGDSDVAAFRRKAEECGWRTAEEDGWILLDRIPDNIPAGSFQGEAGTEARCCAGILRRHPENRKDGTREKRILIKADEEGREAFEKACRVLHHEMAEALRKGEPLPYLPAEYFKEGKRT